MSSSVPEVGVTRILDIAHAQQHLWDVSKAAFGAGSRAGIVWVQAPLRALERGDLPALCQSLAAVAAGYQIGSGLAESACKRFGTDQMKGAGMRWTVAGAQRVATLRMYLLSDRWDEVRAHCRKPAA